MVINNSTGARVSWLLFFCLTGILPFVHAQELNKSKASQSPTVTEDAGTWFLAGREGGCAPVSILSRKGPEYGNVQSPYQLVEKLRATGHKADFKELSTGKSPAVEVTAPSAGLAVLFVKKEFCEKMLAPPAKN